MRLGWSGLARYVPEKPKNTHPASWIAFAVSDLNRRLHGFGASESHAQHHWRSFRLRIERGAFAEALTLVRGLDQGSRAAGACACACELAGACVDGYLRKKRAEVGRAVRVATVANRKDERSKRWRNARRLSTAATTIANAGGLVSLERREMAGSETRLRPDEVESRFLGGELRSASTLLLERVDVALAEGDRRNRVAAALVYDILDERIGENAAAERMRELRVRRTSACEAEKQSVLIGPHE